MARILESEIERLKQEVSLERLVASQGIELKRHGADLLGLSPFHDDCGPSSVVSPKKNLWHCLGACQTGGSVIDWVIQTRGVSFRHAVETGGNRGRRHIKSDPTAGIGIQMKRYYFPGFPASGAIHTAR